MFDQFDSDDGDIDVSLPSDLGDRYFEYVLAGEDATKLEAVRMLSVRDAVLWRFLRKFQRYVDREFVKRHQDGK